MHDENKIKRFLFRTHQRFLAVTFDHGKNRPLSSHIVRSMLASYRAIHARLDPAPRSKIFIILYISSALVSQ